MKLQHIELSKLKLSPINVRKHGGKDVDDLVASIRSLGVIQPLLVRPNCDGFEVIAGQRRLLACQALAQETGKADPVPCAVLESGDDAVAIEASLAENVARLPMDEIDQYEAFAALTAQGRSIADIAGQFGVTELLVKRRLAIAELIDPILNAYRKGDIDAETLRQLTMATKTQQKAWFKLFRDPKQHAPTGKRLKAWLFGGAEIPVSSALFPPEQYGGAIVSDLFGEERYFDDAQKFWKLQLEAVIHRQAAYLEAGWSDVVIMETGKSFNQYDKVKRAKKEGGKVYISCAANGEIGFHEGWLDQKEAARIDKAKAAAKAKGKDAKEDQAPAKPELTKAAIRYLDLHRQNAVRVELLKSPQIALRLIAASAVSNAGLWDVRPELQFANGNKAIAESIRASKAQAALEAERQAVRELLNLPYADGALLKPWPVSPDTCTLFARLLEMTDKDVLRVLTALMAESLPAGSAEVEVLGHNLGVDMDKWWSPDDAFFDLLRDKPAITAMVEEVAGNRTAAQYRTDTAKAQKDVIRDSLAGARGRKKVEGWKPRYMRFPMQAYTKRRGLPAVARWNAVKKLFDKKQ
jgi:ParB family transcriptional regulator, chromosome partitioning protein